MGLNPRFVLGDLDLTDYPFGVEFGSDLGNAQSVTDVLASLLADGEIESRSRRSNREIRIPLLLEGADLAELASSERALVAECDKQRNTLSIDPGDDFGPTTVFETFAADPQRQYNDDEERANVRRWVLTIRALPFGRSVDKIVDNAGTPPSTGGTLLYNCQSTTGWTPGYSTYPPEYVVDTTIFTEGTGSLRSRMQRWGNRGNYGESGYSGYGNFWDKVAGLSLSTSTGGYLAVSVRAEYTLTRLRIFMTSATLGRQEVTNFMPVSRDATGFVRYVFPVAAGLTITSLEFMVDQDGPIIASLTSPAYHTWYDDVELLPSATTDHQIVKQLDVKGSARASGSLHIAAPTDVVALGQVLAISAPASELPPGFQPDGRRWVTQGVTTTDATSPDGSYYTPNTTAYDASSTSPAKPIFDVPAAMLTAGPYTIVAMVKAEASSLTFGVQGQLRVGSTNTGPTSAAQVSPTGLTTGWQFITVGTVYLPPLPMRDAAATTKVRLLFKGAKFSNVYMIPAWQVAGRPAADFSIVDCGTGTPAAGGSSSNLWIDSPSTSQPQGGWWRGPTSDRLNTQSAWPDAKKPGVHVFSPEPMTVFLVSTGAAGPTLALEYYPAWLGSAAL